MLEERQAKRKAKMEEQRLKAVKEANKKAELEESKLQEHQKHQQELLQKLNRETDEQKRRNLKVGLEYSGRLLKERIEETGDEQTKKKLDRWLNVEYTQLLETAIGTAIHRSKYLNKLERRKKDRGHSGSEEYLKQQQKLQEAKKAFGTDVKAKQHKDIDEEFSELKEVLVSRHSKIQSKYYLRCLLV
mmetsp:Transcript_9986/g.14937  ORF Transcript_9986/g.14937 Transcript_9986/m.14937 type:complete len:188 (-) Transcript_9986:1832-2395(-)